MIERTSVARYASIVGIMALGMAMALGIGVLVRGVALATGDLIAVTSVLVFVTAVALCLLRFGYARLACTVLAMTAMFEVILLALLEAALLATQDRPFADAFFAAADLVVAPWLHWYDLAIWFSRHPMTSQACEWVYHSIAWQPFLLIASLCWSGRLPEAWRFIGMWTLALMICEIVFAFYPGVGAYVYYHVDAALTSPTSEAVSSGQLHLLTKLRAMPKIIDGTCLGSIITFPSFHAVAAALLARGYWRIPRLRWPFAALNLAMLGTTIPMGGHYVVDLIAGLAVAAVAIAIFDAPPLEWRAPRRFAYASARCSV